MSANDITILWPQSSKKHARKRIAADGEILDADKKLAMFKHKTVTLGGIKHLHRVVSKLAHRNALVVRGAPASDRLTIHRHTAHIKNHGDNGFEDVPKFWAAFDLDGVQLPALTDWRDDPLGAVDYAVGQLPECFHDASYSWAFSGTHGLEKRGGGGKDEKKFWTGAYTGDEVRLRLWFWLSRAVAERELRTWMKGMRDMAPVDDSVAGVVQPIYTARPVCADGSDPLAKLGVPLSGFRQGLEDAVIVPDDLVEEAKWSRAEGHAGSCASHPSAEAAIRAIGKPSHPTGKGEIRSHWKSAALHLARNERTAGREPDPAAMHARIVEAIEQHRDEIDQNLKAGGRSWGEVNAYLHGDDVLRFCEWVVEHVDDDDGRGADGGGGRKRVQRVSKAPPPEDGIVFVTQQEARAIASERVKAFVTAATVYATGAKHDEHGNAIEAPRHLLALPTGAGKTHAAIMGVKALAAMGQVAWLVPTHKLGDEAADRIKAGAPELSVVVRRGREQPDPLQPGKQMCHRVEDARAVLEHGLMVGPTLCKVETKDADTGETKVTLCPFHSQCGYIRQQAAVTTADVVVAAHAHLFTGKPGDMAEPVAVFVDESAWAGAAGGTDAPVAVGLGALLKPPVELGQALWIARKKIGEALAAEPDGPVRRDVLAPMAGVATDATGLEWGRVRKLPVPVTNLQGAALRERLEATRGGAYGVRNIKRMGAFWRAVGEGAMLTEGVRSGRLWLVTTDKETGAREVHISWKAEIAPGWRDVPMFLMDATADITVLREVFGQVQPSPRYAVRNKNVTVRQVVDRSFAHATLVPPPEALAPKGKKAKTARNNASKVYARLVADALVRYCGQEVLAVVPLAVEQQWRQTMPLPSWLHVLHHGAVTGIDAYGGVRAVYVIGRMLPSAQAVERVAGALTGVAVEVTGYRKAAAIIATADGRGVETWAMRHPDQLCEAIRQQTTEAGVIQAAGRIRAINRTAKTPADINLWVDIALPDLGPVEPLIWRGPTADEAMLARGCWFGRAGDAVTAYPDLGTRQAVEDARKRAECKFCLEDTFKQNLHSGLTPIRYRLAKARSGAAEAVFLGAAPDEARRFIEARLGPLAAFEVIQPEARLDPARPPAEPVAPVRSTERPMKQHAPAAEPPPDRAPPPEPPPPPPGKPQPKPVAVLPGLGVPTPPPGKAKPFSGLAGFRTVALAGAGSILLAPPGTPPPRPKPWLAAAAGQR
jgi:hypothetical protein